MYYVVVPNLRLGLFHPPSLIYLLPTLASHCTQFVAIQVVGLNKGLVVGVGFSVVIFVINYASERR